VANVFYERMAATVRRLMAFLIMATALLILGVALVSLLAILSLYVAPAMLVAQRKAILW